MTTTVACGSPVGAGCGSVSSSFSSSSAAFFLPGGPLGTTPVPPVPGGQLDQLALAEQRGSAEAVALLRHLADDLESERLAEALELLQRRPWSASVTPESSTPTSTALDRGASVGADIVVG
jgi:hypothetical protein